MSAVIRQSVLWHLFWFYIVTEVCCMWTLNLSSIFFIYVIYKIYLTIWTWHQQDSKYCSDIPQVDKFVSVIFFVIKMRFQPQDVKYTLPALTLCTSYSALLARGLWRCNLKSSSLFISSHWNYTTLNLQSFALQRAILINFKTLFIKSWKHWTLEILRFLPPFHFLFQTSSGCLQETIIESCKQFEGHLVRHSGKTWEC